MSIDEFFGSWVKCIDKDESFKIIKLLSMDSNYTPSLMKVFNAFKACPYSKFRVLFLGQDPYPQEGVATGLAFANSSDTQTLSPSLNIIKSSLECLEIPHKNIIFAPSLEEWAEQGVLLLNASLTCKINKPGSHQLLWRIWMVHTLTRIGEYNTGLVCVLFGNAAQEYEKYLGPNQHIIKVEHPAYLARTNQMLDPTIWTRINDILYKQNGETIKWYKTYEDF